MDFVAGQRADGRRFRALTMLALVRSTVLLGEGLPRSARLESSFSDQLVKFCVTMSITMPNVSRFG